MNISVYCLNSPLGTAGVICNLKGKILYVNLGGEEGIKWYGCIYVAYKDCFWLVQFCGKMGMLNTGKT